MFLREVASAAPWAELDGWAAQAVARRGPPVRQILRLAQGGPLLGFAVTPDGTRVAAIGRGGLVRVWTIAGREVTVTDLRGASGTYFRVALSPDGSRIAAGGEGGRVWLWSVGGDLIGVLGRDRPRVGRRDAAAARALVRRPRRRRRRPALQPRRRADRGHRHRPRALRRAQRARSEHHPRGAVGRQSDLPVARRAPALVAPRRRRGRAGPHPLRGVAALPRRRHLAGRLPTGPGRIARYARGPDAPMKCMHLQLGAFRASPPHWRAEPGRPRGGGDAVGAAEEIAICLVHAGPIHLRVCVARASAIAAYADVCLKAPLRRFTVSHLTQH